MQEKRETLRAYCDGSVIFTDGGNWLYPLFDLERYLKEHSCENGSLVVEDTVVGKAAALLMLRMGVAEVRAGILSTLAARVFESANISYSYGELVEKIQCATEEILSAIDDTEEAYLILRKRAAR